MYEMRAPVSNAEMKGWLYKWTNYLKGYQKRWFVLSDGLLSYYRHKAAHTCRGTICLNGAKIHIEDSCTFVISNGLTQPFHLKASNEVERQTWVTALELAKSQSVKKIESDEEDDTCDSGEECEVFTMMKNISSCLEQVETCSELISKHGGILQKALTELDVLDSEQDVSLKMLAIKENLLHLRIASSAMINCSKEYVRVAEQHSKTLEKMLQHERSQKENLEEIVEQLAKQHSKLEQATEEHRWPKTLLPSDDEDSIEFYECEENINVSSDSFKFVLKMPNGQVRLSSPYINEQLVNAEEGSISNDIDPDGTKAVMIPGTLGPPKPDNTIAQRASLGGGKPRRNRVPDKPHCSLNLWSVMKNCIGKELSKISIPVNFCEPLSMLQRLTEDYEYSFILDFAATLPDSDEQLAYIAAFTVSCYASTSNRIGKPFNPLLGETYECDRMEDLGWRAISEQVSHHPPMVALHCEGKSWTCWQEFGMTSKFRGKYLQVIPLGIAHLVFSNGNHYTWRKVTTTVHNIIVGKVWVDQQGDMDIINHTDGSKCKLIYTPYSLFNREDQRKVKGYVMKKDGSVSWIIKGNWDTKIEIAQVLSIEGTKRNPIYKTGSYKVVWQRWPATPGSEKYYNFTVLACQLNEPEEGVAPTDSRNRPDQRLMEEGRWNEANQVKIQLEEKQRAVRRAREAQEGGSDPPAQYKPIWFKREIEPVTGSLIHMYKGDYWNAKRVQDWSKCPSIF